MLDELTKELSGYSFPEGSLVTIGVFDGVHLGHRHLVAQLRKRAARRQLRTVAITFDRHPQEVLTPGSHPPFLTDSDEKARLLKELELDAVIVLTFTPQLASVGAREFASALQQRLNMKGLVVGPDFAMGRDNEGSIDALRELGQEMRFTVAVIPPVTKNGEIVSSTAIRKALAAGNMEKVQRLMGRPFSLHGRVVHGKGRGRGLGFPTVNLGILLGQALPADGVYAGRAIVAERLLPAVTNVGTNPTFGESARTVEAFLVDFHEDLYEHEVRIDFVSKLRDEIKFSDVEELKQQIARDVVAARDVLDNSL